MQLLIEMLVKITGALTVSSHTSDLSLVYGFEEENCCIIMLLFFHSFDVLSLNSWWYSLLGPPPPKKKQHVLSFSFSNAKQPFHSHESYLRCRSFAHLCNFLNSMKMAIPRIHSNATLNPVTCSKPCNPHLICTIKV